MKQTAVEWFQEQIIKIVNGTCELSEIQIFEQAKEMEKEQMLNIIKCYHNNLFYVPLNENGEAEAILKLIQTGQIKSKL
jgi:hypothetical protein